MVQVVRGWKLPGLAAALMAAIAGCAGPGPKQLTAQTSSRPLSGTGWTSERLTCAIDNTPIEDEPGQDVSIEPETFRDTRLVDREVADKTVARPVSGTGFSSDRLNVRITGRPRAVESDQPVSIEPVASRDTRLAEPEEADETVARPVSGTGFSSDRLNVRITGRPRAVEADQPSTDDGAAEVEMVLVADAQDLADEPDPHVAESDLIVELAEGSVGPTKDRVSDVETPRMPVDLATVLRLAGADNWAVRLAREEVNEACANADLAESLWLPNINLGIGYTQHNGQLQATDGTVSDVTRNSLFIGGGARVSDAPMTGGAGGPARFFVDLSIADALFEPLAARQLLSARRSQESAVFNSTLLEAALAYYNLVAAQGQFAIAEEDLADAEAVERLTEAFVKAGKSAPLEVTRVQVETRTRRQRLIQASLAIQIASTRLARILQLDPEKLEAGTLLHSVEQLPAPVELVENADDVGSVMSQAMSSRPEVSAAVCREQAACTRLAQEQWRPWLPHLNLGLSGGAFGGAPGSSVNRLGNRFDVDAGLVWEVRNLGFGTQARQDQRESQHLQAVLSRHQLSDSVAAEAAEAWYQVQAHQEALELARKNIATAAEVYNKNRERIRGLVGLPLEALQALQAVSAARYEYLLAVTEYNQAQCRLLRAVGVPIEAPEPSEADAE